LKGLNGLKATEDSFSQSKLIIQTINSQSKLKISGTGKEKEDFVLIDQSLEKFGKENEIIKRDEKPAKKAIGKKKTISEQDYEISELDNTKEIVRKTDIAVRTLAKKGDLIKRDIKSNI